VIAATLYAWKSSTYIRLRRGFVYLAVVLDSLSRKVIGWNLGRTLKTDLPLGELQLAIGARKPPVGLVHKSDRGAQYASDSYLHHIVPSTSGAGNPYDSARCESFLKTLKAEEINGKQYSDLDDLHRNPEAFLETEYNRIRLHSALGFRPLEEFEGAPRSEVFSAAAVSFPGRRKSIPMPSSEKAGASQRRSGTHRNEFPTGSLPLHRSFSFCNSGLRCYTLFQRMEGVPSSFVSLKGGNCTMMPSIVPDWSAPSIGSFGKLRIPVKACSLCSGSAGYAANLAIHFHTPSLNTRLRLTMGSGVA
jgi:hypothetical protein